MSASSFHVVRSMSAVEAGFMAAGITVCIIAVIQSLAIVLSWMGII